MLLQFHYLRVFQALFCMLARSIVLIDVDLHGCFCDVHFGIDGGGSHPKDPWALGLFCREV